VTFTLTRDPAALPSATTVNYTGRPTGTGNVVENAMSLQEVNTGMGATSSIGNMTLTFDGTACTFKFDWEWGIDTTLTIMGANSGNFTPDDIAGIQSTVLPAGAWQSGIAYSANFPLVGNPGGMPLVGDAYVPVSQIGSFFFLTDPTPETPGAPIMFSATPDLVDP
jgi:hypothetical protein